MKDRQFVTPVLIRNGAAEPLTRIPLDERTFKESWLQELLYTHPEMIPVGEIEPVFEGLRAVA